MSDEKLRSLLTPDGKCVSVLALMSGEHDMTAIEIVDVIRHRLKFTVAVRIIDSSMAEMNDWCFKNCTHMWFTPLWWGICKTWPAEAEYWFESESDAAFFTLAWLK